MKDRNRDSLYRKLPAVDAILNDGRMRELLQRYSRSFVVRAINTLLDELRREIASGALDREQLSSRVDDLPQWIARKVEEDLCPSLRGVINATGVVLYTNAGRAPLAPETLDHLREHLVRYTNLEYDLESGSRGHRDLHFETRICSILGSEAATVCNNAAAALILILNTLAEGRKVLVSRGELIEIGGSFRLPTIMEKSGAVLKEVGTTNKTRASDYRDAVDEHTALILRVHPSNYEVVGFSERPGLSELVALSEETGIPLAHDLGSGCLFEESDPFLQREPVVERSLRAGVDLACFSGDKLLGGPQAGLILGRKQLIDRIRKNPFMRAFRVDKLTYAALEHVLIQYRSGQYGERLPIWRMMRLSKEEIAQRARVLLEDLRELSFEVRLQDGVSLVGGGSAPEEGIPTTLLQLRHSGRSAGELSEELRLGTPAILARIEDDSLLFDLRTVFADQDALLLKRLRQLETN